MELIKHIELPEKYPAEFQNIFALRSKERNFLESQVDEWKEFEEKLVHLAKMITMLKSFYPDYFNKVAPVSLLSELGTEIWDYLINQLD